MPRQFPALGTDVRELTAEELKARLDAGESMTLLDTRRPSDFETWHITHPNLEIINIPFTTFMQDDDETPVDSIPADVADRLPVGELVTCCAKGLSSFFVAEVLKREGWDVLALEDGMEGWAALLETRPLDTREVEVIQFHRPSSGCLSYLFIADGEAAVIDPLRAFADKYVEAAAERNATLAYALDTHVHADHVSGVRAIADLADADVVLPAGASARGLAYEATLIAAGETLSLGATELTAVGLPGHTTEMLGYRLGDVMATGDTVFVDGVARPDLEDADQARAAAATLWETLQELATLADELVIAPGHASPATAAAVNGPISATVGELRDSLDAFDESQDDFVARVTGDLPPRPANFQEIIAINLGRRRADSDEAFELELGPNNCAVAE